MSLNINRSLYWLYIVLMVRVWDGLDIQQTNRYIANNEHMAKNVTQYKIIYGTFAYQI